MDPHPDDLTAVDDLTLVHAARAGDRLAFGVLYLRHHAAAWRIACVASRFSPDAELAVIEGFTRVFSALPAEPEEFDRGRRDIPPLPPGLRASSRPRPGSGGWTGRAGQVPPGAGVRLSPAAGPAGGPGARRRGRPLDTGAPRRPGGPRRSAGAVPQRPLAVRCGGDDPRRGGRNPRLHPGDGRRDARRSPGRSACGAADRPTPPRGEGRLPVHGRPSRRLPRRHTRPQEGRARPVAPRSVPTLPHASRRNRQRPGHAGCRSAGRPAARRRGTTTLAHLGDRGPAGRSPSASRPGRRRPRAGTSPKSSAWDGIAGLAASPRWRAACRRCPAKPAAQPGERSPPWPSWLPGSQ